MFQTTNQSQMAVSYESNDLDDLGWFGIWGYPMTQETSTYVMVSLNILGNNSKSHGSSCAVSLLYVTHIQRAGDAKRPALN